MARRQHNSGAWTPQRAQQQTRDRYRHAPNVDRWRAEAADPTTPLHRTLATSPMSELRERLLNHYTVAVDPSIRPGQIYFAPGGQDWRPVGTLDTPARFEFPDAVSNVAASMARLWEPVTSLGQSLRSMDTHFAPKRCECGNPTDPYWEHGEDGCDFRASATLRG